LALSVGGDTVLTAGIAADLHPIRSAEHATVYVELDTINHSEVNPSFGPSGITGQSRSISITSLSGQCACLTNMTAPHGPFAL
jgi:hypothetical protein